MNRLPLATRKKRICGTVLIIIFSWFSQKGQSHGMNILKEFMNLCRTRYRYLFSDFNIFDQHQQEIFSCFYEIQKVLLLSYYRTARYLFPLSLFNILQCHTYVGCEGHGFLNVFQANRRVSVNICSV